VAQGIYLKYLASTMPLGNITIPERVRETTDCGCGASRLLWSFAAGILQEPWVTGLSEFGNEYRTVCLLVVAQVV
jgi:hypothetical protein